MEQALLDSSKFKIYSMSIDSRFADQVYKGTGDFMIRLPSTYRNIMRIAVSSVELPLVEYLFSVEHGNLDFSVKLGAGAWTVLQLHPGNYSGATLVAAITTLLNGVSAGFSCSLDPITNTVTISHTTTSFHLNLTSGNSTIAARPTHWGLGYYLGIRTKGTIDSDSSRNVTGTSTILVQPTPYYLLQLQCPDMLENITHRVSAGASVPAFAKLVLRGAVYVLQFVDGGDWMRREYTFLAPSNISQLRVKLLDPYGEIVNMQGMDWSLTFEMYEVVNQRTYRGLAETYERP